MEWTLVEFWVVIGVTIERGRRCWLDLLPPREKTVMMQPNRVYPHEAQSTVKENPIKQPYTQKSANTNNIST